MNKMQGKKEAILPMLVLLIIILLGVVMLPKVILFPA